MTHARFLQDEGKRCAAVIREADERVCVQTEPGQLNSQALKGMDVIFNTFMLTCSY